jgi:hypothetical protein
MKTKFYQIYLNQQSQQAFLLIIVFKEVQHSKVTIITRLCLLNQCFFNLRH